MKFQPGQKYTTPYCFCSLSLQLDDIIWQDTEERKKINKVENGKLSQRQVVPVLYVAKSEIGQLECLELVNQKNAFMLYSWAI